MNARTCPLKETETAEPASDVSALSSRVSSSCPVCATQPSERPLPSLRIAGSPERPLRRDLCAILSDGAVYSLMVGMGETYLPAFVLALGMGDLAAALIVTVPLLAGAILQLVSPLAVRKLGSHRRWVVLCAATQATAFLPLIVAALVGQIPVLGVFLIASVYWGASMGTGPAWNTWVETLVPSRVRARYFSRRNRIAQAGVLIGFVMAGIALHEGKLRGYEMWAFACLFLASAICRFSSAALIASQSEPEPPRADRPHLSVADLLRRLGHGPDGKLLLYLIAMQFGVQVAGPYFAPFMLRELHFTYLEFMVLVGTSFVFKSLAAPLMGSIAHRFGARRLLTVGGIAVVPMSAGWLVSDNFFYLLVLQAAAGAAWAGYELAMFLLYLENIQAEERTSVLTTYNVVHALSTVGGSLFGGAVFKGLGGGMEGFLTVFAVSFVCRVLTIPLLRRVPHSATADTEEMALAVEPQVEALLAPAGPSATGGSR